VTVRRVRCASFANTVNGQSLPNKSIVSPRHFTRKPMKKPSAVAWLLQAAVQHSDDLERASKTDPSSFSEEGISPLFSAAAFSRQRVSYPNESVCKLQIGEMWKLVRSMQRAPPRDTEFINSHMEIFIYHTYILVLFLRHLSFIIMNDFFLQTFCCFLELHCLSCQTKANFVYCFQIQYCNHWEFKQRKLIN